MSWRCCKRGCCGSLKTNKDYDLVEEKPHNHMNDIKKIKEKKVLQLMKERAILTDETSRSIVLRVINDENCVENLEYNTKYLLEQVNKARKLSIPQNTKTIDLPYELTHLSNGVDFVLYDSGNSEFSRIVMFGTKSNLIQLENSVLWVIDCTFKVVPRSFEQLLITQAKILDVNVPLVFCLLSNKQQLSYEKVFSLLKSFLNKEPRDILLDFEAGLCFRYQKTLKVLIYTCVIFIYHKYSGIRFKTLDIHLNKNQIRFFICTLDIF
jgi:hypothetical protein